MAPVTAASDSDARAPDTAEAFAHWVEPWLTRMANLAARLAPEADRDDVVQEALMRAWNKRRQFDPTRGSAAAWLLAITADKARHARRRRVDNLLQADVAADAASPEVRIDVEDALSLLTDRQRLAVDCFYFVGLSIAETAAVMRCADGTVKSTLSDARARMRPMLEVRE